MQNKTAQSNKIKIRNKKKKKVARNSKEKSQPLCSICGKSFSNVRNLNRHINVKHTLKKLFPCSECSKIFKTKINLQSHVNSVHSTDPKLVGNTK